MRFSVLTGIVSACVLAGAVVVGAQGPGGDDDNNLQVLPDTWTRQQVGALMQTFNQSLGVECSHCHAEDPDAPPPNPGQGPRLDYSLDDKMEKEVARNMLRMTMNMNENMGDENRAEKMSCWTCHRGDATPDFDPEDGWSRGQTFSLTEEGPVVPARGGGPGGGAGRGGAGGQ